MATFVLPYSSNAHIHLHNISLHTRIQLIFAGLPGNMLLCVLKGFHKIQWINVSKTFHYNSATGLFAHTHLLCEIQLHTHPLVWYLVFILMSTPFRYLSNNSRVETSVPHTIGVFPYFFRIWQVFDKGTLCSMGDAPWISQRYLTH